MICPAGAVITLNSTASRKLISWPISAIPLPCTMEVWLCATAVSLTTGMMRKPPRLGATNGRVFGPMFRPTINPPPFAPMNLGWPSPFGTTPCNGFDTSLLLFQDRSYKVAPASCIWINGVVTHVNGQKINGFPWSCFHPYKWIYYHPTFTRWFKSCFFFWSPNWRSRETPSKVTGILGPCCTGVQQYKIWFRNKKSPGTSL